MALFNISYDLKNGDSKDYSRLYQILQSYDDWAHPLESTWLIRTKKSADEVFQDLRPLIHKDDKLLIMLSVVPGSIGTIDKSMVDWFQRNNYI